jgi:serine/threonine protein kinase
MNRYKVTKQLGDGTYGSVLKATHRQTGEVVRDCSFMHTKQCPILITLLFRRLQSKK